MRLNLSIWGVPVVRLWHRPGPGEPPPPVPAMTGARDADLDGPPIETAEEPPATVERMDVPPERRPWDTTRGHVVDADRPPTRTEPPPPPPPAGARRVQIESLPHCDGRHDIKHDGARCEYCDALTGAVSLVRSLEKRVTALEERLNAPDVPRAPRGVGR